jgi:predicted O-methyltransferase YrrM
VVPGRFQDTLADVAREQAPVDFAFIDGHHDEHATVAYFRQILPHLGRSAVLVFDDISWSPGMERAWKTVTADERVGLAVDLSAIGICLVSDSLPKWPILRMRLL